MRKEHGHGKIEIIGPESLKTERTVYVENTDMNTMYVKTALRDALSGIEKYDYYINDELKATTSEDTYAFTKFITENVEPYIPAGFEHTEGTVETGFVIKDVSSDKNKKGNEFVWIPVIKSEDLKIYVIATDKVGNTKKSETITASISELMRGILGDKTDLNEYTEDEGDLSNKKSLAFIKQSIKENGGFYVARYEAGIPDSLSTAQKTATKAARNVKGIPVSTKRSIPWNYITKEMAKKNAESAYNLSSAQSALMNSYTWDVIMNYFIKKQMLTQTQILSDGRVWGNYYNSSVKNVNNYSTNDGSSWYTGNNITKGSNSMWLLKTGDTDFTKMFNIYDLAGNLGEWTTEKYNNQFVYRGGDFANYGSQSAGTRLNKSENAYNTIGFRMILYKQLKKDSISINITPTEWTKENVTANIEFGESVTNRKAGYGATLEDAIASITNNTTNKVDVAQNGYVYAEGIDAFGEKIVEYIKIDNIDKTGPNRSAITDIKIVKNNVKANINLLDNEDGCGIDITNSKYIFDNSSNLKGINSEEWNMQNAISLKTQTTQIEKITADTGSYYIHVLAQDKLGNKIELISKEIQIDAIEPTIISLEQENKTANLNELTKLIGKAQDKETGIVAYQFSTNPAITAYSEGWIEITQTTEEIIQTYEIGANAVYYFYVKDAGQSVAKASIVVNNFHSRIGQYEYSYNYSCSGCQTRSYTHTPGCLSRQYTCSGCQSRRWFHSNPNESKCTWVYDAATNKGYWDCYGHLEKYCPGHTEYYCPGHTESYCPGNHTAWGWSNYSYTVKYDANGGNGSMSNSGFYCNTEYELRKNTFKREGYIFTGWSKYPNATTASYSDKAKVKNLSVTRNQTVTLYAIWKPI